jgi:hypothetical protein
MPGFSSSCLWPSAWLLQSSTCLFAYTTEECKNLVRHLTISPTVSWWWSEQPVHLIHSKSMLFLMTAVICCSTELKRATSAIMDSIKVTAVTTVYTSFSHVSLNSCEDHNSFCDIIWHYLWLQCIMAKIISVLLLPSKELFLMIMSCEF